MVPVYDGAGPAGRAWVHGIAAGGPVIVFATFPTQNGLDHRYHYARWTGTGWQVTEFADGGRSIDETGTEPDYSGGLSLDPCDPSVVYLSRMRADGWNIERWVCGASFSTSVVCAGSGPAVKNVRPVVPWGGAGPRSVLWMSGEYHHWKGRYRTSIVGMPR